MYGLTIFRGERSELGVVVGLRLDAVLAPMSAKLRSIGHLEKAARTAPYLEMCRTNSDASLKSGRGTMVAVERNWCCRCAGSNWTLM
jgi:hypothetical protein